MSLNDALMKLERKFAWNLVGLLIGVIFGVTGLYLALHEKRPLLVYQLIAQFNALDVNQSLPDLTVLYKGEDIQRSSLNLRAMRVRIVNDGESDILQGQFDANEEWGLYLRHARVLEARLIDASNDYLRRSASPSILGDSAVRFSKVILERQQHFTVELLLLHSKSETPTLTPFGKIAGTAPGSVVVAPNDATDKSLLQQLFVGTVTLHLLRLVTYFVIGLLLAFILIAVSVGIGTKVDEFRRESRSRELRLLLPTASPEEVVAKELLVDIYGATGVAGLQRIRDLIEDKEFLHRQLAMQRSRELVGRRRGVRVTDPDIPMRKESDLRHSGDAPSHTVRMAWDVESLSFEYRLSEGLRHGRLIVEENGEVRPHPALAKLLHVALVRSAEEPSGRGAKLS